MRQKLLSVVAIGAVSFMLTACENNKVSPSTYPDWPKPTAQQSGPQPGSVEAFHQAAKDRVFFNLDGYSLSPEAEATLASQANWLKNWPAVGVIVEGHCDERGTTEYNLALGERRANTVKRFLIAHGIDASRIDVVSYGKEHPEDPGHDESSWAKNRRAVTMLR